MKISVDDKELFTLTDTQKKVLQYDIPIEIFEDDIKRRIIYYPIHKCEQCFKRMKAEWDLKLTAAGIKSIPTDEEAYAKLVFSQPDYKDKSARKLEADKKLGK